MRLTLRDRNRGFIDAARRAFADLIESGRVTATIGDIFDDADEDALLSPANSFGYMDGGIDAAYTARFGASLESRVQAAIDAEHFGELHIGNAVIVSTGDVPIRWLVAAPTMRIPMDVARTLNAYVAFRAALIAIVRHNTASPAMRIASLRSPGLCTSIGRMNPDVAARQMRSAWDTIIAGKRYTRPQDALRSQEELGAPQP